MVPQYCYYGSSGMPAVPAIISMSEGAGWGGGRRPPWGVPPFPPILADPGNSAPRYLSQG